ncbi:glycosyltransferase family 2 protein [Maribellus maritimus]|uniref:glycosyltransferase family 2 protein n=1 Tax=Maribellus maritimus TaxID=2870838 RepID=UPI001EECBC8E|nr:glycosyltransferase family 2 protein [Maribellus maritimus]MCG6190408.1 glycosyltransferase family 2 protein [Maribellus maritimus]
MTQIKKVAIVILNWNGATLFEKFLPSVIKNSTDENVKLYVADNCSTDNSIELLKTKFPSVKIIQLIENYGFARGYNLALQQIKADVFILLNSDVEVTPNWISKCIELFEKNPKIAAIQPKILSFEKPHLFEYAGAGGGFIDKYGYPFCRGRILNQMEADLGQYDRATPIFWASGACMFMKAEAFEKAGGLDADFWAHMEEIDLCWRLKNLGYEVWYQPESVVFHLGGGTLSYGSPKKIYLNFRNNLWMMFKNLPKYKFKRIFLSRMVLDGIAAIKFIAGFNFREFWAVFKAHVAFYKELPKLIKKRKMVQLQMIVKDHNEVYDKSIMWNFFIQRKRKFSELNFESQLGQNNNKTKVRHI